MTLKENLLSLEARLLGNRINVAGACLTAGSYFVGKECASDSPDSLASTMCVALYYAGIYAMGYSKFGTSTAKIYGRSREHLQKFGKMDRRFLQRCVGKDAGKKITGYCQLQGIYLAFRNYAPEQLSDFKRLKKACTQNIVPNF